MLHLNESYCHMWGAPFVAAAGLHFPGGLRAPAVDCHSDAEQQRHCQDTYRHCKSYRNTCEKDFFFFLSLAGKSRIGSNV